MENTAPAATSDSIFSMTKPQPSAAADDLLANAFSSSSTNTQNTNSSNFFMSSSTPVQNTPAFNLNQPQQPQPSPFMQTSQPSSGFNTQPMQGFGTQPQQSGGFGFVNTQPSSGFGMQSNSGFGMQSTPNTGF